MFKHICTLYRYGQERSFSGSNYCDRKRLSLTSLEVITDALLEIMEVSDSLLLIYLKVYCNSKCDNHIGILVSSYKKIVHLLYHGRYSFGHFLLWCIIIEELHNSHVILHFCLSLCMWQLKNDWLDFHEVWYWIDSLKFVDTFQFFTEVKHFTWRSTFIPATNVSIAL